MAGSNLPPGVTDSMLPGNTEADRQWDALCEELSAIVPDANEDQIEKLATLVLEKCSACENSGYQSGYKDAEDEAAVLAAGEDI